MQNSTSNFSVDPGPFISTSGNPENDNFGDFADYLKAIDSMTIECLEEAYTRACDRLSKETVLALEQNPRVQGDDNPYVGHAKRLFMQIALVRSGVRYDPDGLYYRV